MSIAINEIAAQRDKWKRRARLFHEAYKEKDFEAFALNLQKLQLEAYGADKVLPMQNESLRVSLLDVCRQRNAILDHFKALAEQYHQLTSMGPNQCEFEFCMHQPCVENKRIISEAKQAMRQPITKQSESA